MGRMIWLVLGLAVGPYASASASAQPAQPAGAGVTVQLGSPAGPAGPAFPEAARLAFVDVDRVAALSAEGKTAAARLQELRMKKAAELSQHGKRVEAIQAQMSQGSPALTDVARRRLEREFQRAQVDFQRFTEDAQDEVRELQEELMQAFTAKLFPVIGAVAKERNLWAVFSSESALLWREESLDLSEEVARRLDMTPEAPR